MATNKKAKATTKREPNTLNIQGEKGKGEERKLAEVQLSPTILNTIVAQSFLKSFAGEVDLTEAVTVMQEKSDKIISGDLSELESTLTAQVVSLNAIFSTLAKRSATSEYVNQMEINMRLALKAQAQCARTIEVLSTLKNPPVIFAKQANIAHGHQQINNGNQSTHAGKTLNSSNELLNEANNATLDTRRTTKASSVNQDMATVETLNGGKDGGRQG
jgi:hypothetical protein